jgi:putative transposase
MRRLLTGYAGYFNRKYRRHGQLFQNRFKSIICQEESYLLELVRYIHLNPLRAKIVTNLNELDSYKFCGHSALMGKEKRDWQDDGYVLGYFGKRLKTARKEYRTYVEKGIELGRRPDLMGGGLIRSLGGWDEVKKMRLNGQERIKSDQRILGDSEFVNEILSESEEQFSRKYRLKRKGYDFNKVLYRVSEIFQLEEEYITGKGRQKARVMARDLLIYWSVNELSISQVDLARRLDITPASVSCAVQRGEKIVKEKEYQLEK